MTVKNRSKGFRKRPIHVRREPHAFHYLSQKPTFWIAVLSMFAFVAGNMLGQHGWRVFWASVLGGADDSLIVYTGTVPPLAKIPDYKRWSQYGGSAQLHMFREAPQDILIPLPSYNTDRQKSQTPDQSVYSIGYMGSYATGREGDGDHPGVDIRVPAGTPVQAVMNGIVATVGEDDGGFGTYVVLRHPNVPDPIHPSKTTTLYSAYAHLSQSLVEEGQIVSKGQEIAQSGQSGLATGPHLHFQIDRDTGTDGQKVAWHPYWPFTSSEARAAGLSFTAAINSTLFQERGFASTVNPMIYVQAQYAPVLVARAEPVKRLTPAELRKQRLEARQARRRTTTVAVAASSSPSSSPAVTTQIVAVADVPVAPASSASSSSASSQVAPLEGFSSIDIVHPRSFTGREWVAVTVRLVGQNGETITNPDLGNDLYLRTAYGRAEFRPAILTALDFQNGEARVEMLPIGRTTVVIEVQPGAVLSTPMKYEGD